VFIEVGVGVGVEVVIVVKVGPEGFGFIYCAIVGFRGCSKESHGVGGSSACS
jgi:hypothetical protein